MDSIMTPSPETLIASVKAAVIELSAALADEWQLLDAFPANGFFLAEVSPGTCYWQVEALFKILPDYQVEVCVRRGSRNFGTRAAPVSISNMRFTPGAGIQHVVKAVLDAITTELIVAKSADGTDSRIVRMRGSPVATRLRSGWLFAGDPAYFDKVCLVSPLRDLIVSFQHGGPPAEHSKAASMALEYAAAHPLIDRLPREYAAPAS